MNSGLRFLDKWMPESERGKTVLWNSITAIALKFFTAGCSLVQVPIALHYLGALEFGLWVTLTSIVSMMAFADFGAGFGIQNRVAEALGRDNSGEINKIIGQGFLLLSFAGCILGALGCYLIFKTGWTHFFSDDSLISGKLKNGAIVLLGIFCLNLPFTGFQRAAVGLQLGWLPNVCLAITNTIAVFLIWLSAKFELGFVVFIAAAAVPLLLSNAVVALALWLRRYWHVGSFLKCDRTLIFALFRQGLPFTMPQLGALVLSLMPPLVIASVLGPELAGKYNIAQRLLAFFASFHGVLMSTLWPAFTEARARNDWHWLRRVYRRSLWLSIVVVALPMAAFPLWGPVVLRQWLGGGVVLGMSFMLAFGLQSAVTVCSVPPAVLLNSMGQVKGQATYGFAVAIIIVATLPWAAAHWGLSGVPAVALLWFSLISLPLVNWEAELAMRSHGSKRLKYL